MRINKDEMCEIVRRNTKVSTKKEIQRTTDYDNETSVVIEVYTVEKPRTSDNIFVGSFALCGILLALRGVPKIKACLDIEVNGTLIVSGEDKTRR